MRRFRDFLNELTRRRVYRVAVVYVVVAWAVIEAASIIVPELMLPVWLTRAVIVVALLAFPLVLVLAWAYDITPEGIQRTVAADERAPEDGAAARTSMAPAASAVPMRVRVLLALCVVLGAGAGIAHYASAAGDRVPRGAELLAALDELVEAKRYQEAFELALKAESEGETVSDSVASRYTDRLTILSDPPGAAVRALRFAGGQDVPESEWSTLGTTPMRGVPVPRGDHLLRIAAPDLAAAERIMSSAGMRSTVGDRSPPELQLDVRLLPADDVPDGMIHVPGGRYHVASRDLQSLSAVLEDFLIDRHEVTNAMFAAFVDAGGYGRREHWFDLAEAAGAGADTLRAQLFDRTMLASPRQWSGQQPPPGMAAHPVTGVSWYEAAAYCRFRGARLPTLFEWEKAARDGLYAAGQGIQMPWGYVGPRDPATDRANFSGTGSMPVGSYPFGLSVYGAYDMAGNAKEWLRNRAEAGRAVTGGSWGDPVYLFPEVGSLDPAAAPPDLGFRCARALESGRTAAAGAQGDVPLRLVVETPVYRPVDEATFRTLLSHYHYDRIPLDAVIEERVEFAAWTRERIRYNGPAGERVLAYLFVPKTGRPPWQTMVYVPPITVFLGHNVADLAEETLGPLVRAGRALLVVVMEGMTEREYPADHEWPESNSVAFRDQMVRRATELRLGLDYLETRDDIDTGALAYVGVSWGAGSRILFAAVDDRFSATVLIAAGIDERVHPTLPEASNINFAPRIRGPKLMVNGRADEEHPWLTRALPLWNLLEEPKELALFEGVGHVPPAELRIPVIRTFLNTHLNR